MSDKLCVKLIALEKGITCIGLRRISALVKSKYPNTSTYIYDLAALSPKSFLKSWILSRPQEKQTLLPRNVAVFKTSVHKAISWTLGTGTAAFVALGQNIVPMGIGQRGAALCILIWLFWLGTSLISIELNSA